MARSISDNVFQMVLAQGNKDQNQHYPPGVFTTHYKLVSDWLKDELVKIYPTSQIIVDLLGPYLWFVNLIVVNGSADVTKLFDPLTKEPLYRNLLGLGFYVNDTESCTPFEIDKTVFADPENPTDKELDLLNVKAAADSKPIAMVTIGEWEYYTNHPYKKPKTFDKAKGCIFRNDRLRILPLGIPFVEVRMVRKVDEFFYGYTPLPDETYVFDPTTTVEEKWTEVAIPYLFKGVNILYSNYVRDTEYIASAKDLRDNSLF